MSRYVDIDTLKIPSEEMIARWIVNSAPSIDIVRCKECKKAFDAEGEIICNHLSGMVGLNVVVNHDDFCSYGERRE